jgi:hypothetical protein
MNDIKETAKLENQAMNAMTALVVEHGYTEADLLILVSEAVADA